MNKTIFNINWDLDNNGIRKIELDYFKNINSNINAGTTGYTVTGSSNSNGSFFFARKRLINLIDIWNRILVSGLFLEDYSNGTRHMIGANVNSVGSNLVTDYLFFTGSYNFDTSSIWNRSIEFIKACSKMHSYILSSGTMTQSKLNEFFSSLDTSLRSVLNYRFDTTTNNFVSLMDQFLVALKEIVSEEKLATECLCNFQNLNFNTSIGLSNILLLKDYSLLFRTYDTTKFPDVLKWQSEDTSSIDLSYPQFATLIVLDSDSTQSIIKNILIKTDNFSVAEISNSNITNLNIPKYLACSLFETGRPVKFRTQLIDWTNDMDLPYIMSYNSSCYIYIPDSIKNQSTLGTYSEQPSQQINISSFFWEIGTSNVYDVNYKSSSDIKLNITKTLTQVDKLDFLDNLSIILKLN